MATSGKPKLIERNLIDGAWRDAEQRIAVTNPATGELLGHVPHMDDAETRDAVAAAKRALPAWSAQTAYARANILMKWHDLVEQNAETLAMIMTLENGKPLADARAEIATGNILWNAEEAKRLYGRIVPAGVPDRQLLVTRQALGVAGMITPWNFPASMITRKVAPALAAGCTVVLKPDHRTPFSALYLAELAVAAGVPAGVLNVITGDAAAIGKILTTHPDVAKISFTGSTPVGKILTEQAAPQMKKLAMELGGNAPFIVFDDVDVAMAATRLAEAKQRNAGQSCVAPNRIYVNETIHDEFVAALLPLVRAWRVGDGRHDVQIGPLIDARAVDKVAQLVDDAVQNGAQCLLGGKAATDGDLAKGSFYQPTILTGVTDDMAIARTEIFGPVLAIQTFADEDDVLQRANASEYGLAAYVFTRDFARIQRMTAGLDYGQVGMNIGVISFAATPFGGMKQSGTGREGGTEGIDSYCETKYIAIQS